VQDRAQITEEVNGPAGQQNNDENRPAEAVRLIFDG
jgi:hypothetical protein